MDITICHSFVFSYANQTLQEEATRLITRIQKDVYALHSARYEFTDLRA